MRPLLTFPIIFIAIYLAFIGLTVHCDEDYRKDVFEVKLYLNQAYKLRAKSRNESGLGTSELLRFRTQEQLFRLHCRFVENFIRKGDEKFDAYYDDMNNMFAVHERKLANGGSLDQVCYLVDAANQTEADCLLRMVNLWNLFPVEEKVGSPNYNPVGPPNRTYCFQAMWLDVVVPSIGIIIVLLIFGCMIASCVRCCCCKSTFKDKLDFTHDGSSMASMDRVTLKHKLDISEDILSVVTD